MSESDSGGAGTDEQRSRTALSVDMDSMRQSGGTQYDNLHMQPPRLGRTQPSPAPPAQPSSAELPRLDLSLSL